ncbi:TetR/AcrR family transcriptional regulator [Actinomycetospora sp. TBRC 11914]|uniref:TetR/AcrR family transcriptional regulator n=1 Tax=Actinomycetospora sp. TBRC 11914 TaxID=2729387 RepID=UPI00145F3312|nr:TetR/AcrR family transcriptional regulator [Actinomycetospora sp. TBRC 11914]NMO91681.1 TetR/AcrR family transcriptional regulator [Actinomycetospora sp. TBRC 11914]
MGRDAAILDAAERLFDAHGYSGIGVDAIGLEAGVSGSAIYRHFSGKEEILSALFDRAIDDLLLRIGSPRTDPDEELEHLIDVHLTFALEHPRLAVIWSREERSLSDVFRRTYQRRQRLYLERWDSALAACYPEWKREELVTVREGLHWLLMSSAVTPVRRSAPSAPTILRGMALAALTALTTDSG